MKFTTQQFVDNFYALSGDTIGERRKSLFQLLNNIHRNDHFEVNFSALQPRTHLETIFKVEVMIYFQNISYLLEMLKSEHPVLINKVLKTKSWFWNEAFKNITGQQFVDDILGFISFNTKVQVLNKLAIYLGNAEKGNEYYDSVKSKYGLYLAAKLIPCCTKKFILSSVEKDNIKLMESKLLLIVKKYPDIIEDILIALKDIGISVSVEYDNVFKYIAYNNITLYLKLRQVYKTSFHLGWRCTQKFVNLNKEDVVNNAKEYYKCFHSRQLVRSLKTHFDSFYIKMFPKSRDDFNRYDFDCVLQTIKHLRRPDINILLKTFENIYGQELWDSPELVSLELLEMLPSAERKPKLQRRYKPHYISDEKWMCYYPTKVAVLYLKERISLCSDINSRAELIGLLVETCKINKDKATLVEICQYVINRHRNDNIAVRLSFLRGIQSSFRLDDLDEEHWVPINELIKIFILNDESFYNAGDFLINYILYRLKHDLSIKEQIIEYYNLKYYDWNLFKECSKFEKLCLLEFADIIKDNDCTDDHVKFLLALISYNLRNTRDQISIFSYPKAIEFVTKNLENRSTFRSASTVFSYCVHLNDTVKERTEFLHYFLTISENCDLDILIYLIHKHPKIVQQHLEKVTNLILKQYTGTNCINFWQYSKNYEHLEIPQNIIKISLMKINQTGDAVRMYERKVAILAMSCLMPSQEYLQIVALHYPPELKADAQTEIGRKAYELQEYIGDSLKFLTPPSDALESILVFCKGDYLKLIQSSLYSVCCNTNEDKLQPFFAELMGRAVSIRKHALHLTFHILDKAEIFSVLDKFMKNEKNLSIRKFIFKHSFNFFVKNRDEYSWELVKLNIIAVDVNDQEAFDILMQYDKIPKNYLDKYLTFTWEFLEKLPDPDNKIEVKKTTLLNSINKEIIPVLGKDFCEPIIEKYFFKYTDSERLTRFQSAVQLFACKYIIYDELTYAEPLFFILKDYVNTTWVKRETESTGRYYVHEFIDKFCGEFLDNNDALPYIAVFTKFVNLWNEFLKPHEAFYEYLHLRLTGIHLEKLPVDGTVRQLATLCNNLVNTYGESVIELILEKINSFVSYFVGSYKQEDIYLLIDNLVENTSSLPCMLLAIRLIDSNKVVSKTKEKYEKIIQILKTKNEPAIQIFLHVHLTKCADTNLN